MIVVPETKDSVEAEPGVAANRTSLLVAAILFHPVVFADQSYTGGGFFDEKAPSPAF